ncbi:N-hydroxyarylamine O-acetyltransferase [Saccharopolyspora kobensis]|uniref:N-hydroxyarylamine O-acetyltransferase n=1 Tax=Saccharopolyspora kobensis TaxID=146035 RepID=A0A1H6E6R0_9PSEU|nr:arylamine N-acetyltransferase [Saccharopolyspora kobensis]SEG93382.1 N-hydroxyarylamine O-acetyltransferase [Saccharopolyspora kobensis]SFD44748.1 N-hydroxyarylamine O-acetyltransferase [Saccharopolyspora kobensis]
MGKHAKDEWRTEKADLEGYLARIGHPAVPGPSVAALRSLHEAHVQAIPFENVDVVLGQHPGIELGTIYDKLVRSRRGGYCFEHALLFAAVLENLGFDVERRMARVDPDGSGYRTHMVLRVRVEGADHLADVGFGAGMLSPMPFEDGAVVDQAGWRHRLVRNGPLWNLEKAGADGWEVLHASDELPQRFTDYEVAHHYVATHPNSPFVAKPVVFRLEPGVSRGLVGNKLTVERASGEREVAEVAPGQLREVLRGLGVELSEQEFAALRKSFEVSADSSLT